MAQMACTCPQVSLHPPLLSSSVILIGAVDAAVSAHCSRRRDEEDRHSSSPSSRHSLPAAMTTASIYIITNCATNAHRSGCSDRTSSWRSKCLRRLLDPFTDGCFAVGSTSNEGLSTIPCLRQWIGCSCRYFCVGGTTTLPCRIDWRHSSTW